ncbi:PREDICTED: WD repeat-containing protein 81 isoform X2 [Trachymyrmex cornetzi]|uniref:WD repeat-containing protein 81 isoform X2 n=1 Tax=Trachymyrmex cornetzi TaxID=471704 RepID=UPI00084F27CE|nr:PREDICTED: WD repeat-containing protein 81 isoform X2 [Trachymyrmex cornetzi]
MDIIKEHLFVPTKYMTLTDERICLTAHRNWLSRLLTIGRLNFICHDRLSNDEIAAQPTIDELGGDWLKIYAKVYIKQHKNVIPLPRGRSINNIRNQAELMFSQLLHYVAETNYRNLWKEIYKKYYNPWNYVEQKEHSNISANVSDVTIMHEILNRMYGCTVVQVQHGTVLSVSNGIVSKTHCNLVPIHFVIETPSAFIMFYEQTANYSLRECVMYSPAALNTSYGKPLFIVYQLLRLSRDLHDRGLALGEITLSDILITDNFTIQVLPKLNDNIYLKPDGECTSISPEHKEKNSSSNVYAKKDDISRSTNTNFGLNENIQKLCEMWMYNCINNFDYLTALNNLAGRRYGNPSCHHVMPWVTDFTTRSGGNWRDLTKSKFRLNKGDRQLDLTFDSQSTEVGHHVSDVLSEITYYVYLSRRYNKSVLCKHVRPLWVPGEYPASIQRLHDWSPDECIPQFFTDPSVFKSIHEDLLDLEIPAWATSPEDFIEKHREALESLHVSERLHHWIDLTFGYKLSGFAAIKSKNVCLQLVDNHTGLTNSGVVQLFTQPHPQKIIPSPYWGKVPPRLRSTSSTNKSKNDQPTSRISDDEGHSSGIEEEESTTTNVSRSPLVLSRLLSRSRGSLLSEDNVKSDKSVNQPITLPKDFNPVAALIQMNETPFRYPTITYMGLPPPSAHQFLQPILSGSLFPFSKYCQYLYNIVEMLQEYNSLVRELNAIVKTEDDMDFVMKTKIKYLCKISECKVKAIARELERLLPYAGGMREATLQLIVPHIVQIMEEPYSAVLAVWHLFDPIAKTLGPKDTVNTFLSPIIKLYENGSIMDTALYVDIIPAGMLAKFRTTRLYHRTFLLKLIVRLGLRRFLDNFINPLVEAVGGYKDYVQGSIDTCTHRTVNLKSCDLSGPCSEGEGILSPLDEDSFADTEHTVVTSSVPTINDMSNIMKNNDIEEVFTMETEDNLWISSNNTAPYDIDLHIELNLNACDDTNDDRNKNSPGDSAKSSTIPIPEQSNTNGVKLVTEFNSIGCNVGSKTSSEDFTYVNTYAMNIHSDNNLSENIDTKEDNPAVLSADFDNKNDVIKSDENVHQLDHIYRKSILSECTISEMSAESVIWLSHRLGPVLTARYLSRNLLRMLTLCYAGKENLTPIDDNNFMHLKGVTWKKPILAGDQNAVKVLECLTSIAGLYGEQIILLQYFAHIVELLALCKRKLTQNLEGGLISCLALLNHITAYLSDSTVMDALHEPIVKSILHPTVRILSTARFTFPNGTLARIALAEKCLEAMFILSLRLGNVITKNHLAVPIQRFFLAFDKAFSENLNGGSNNFGQKANTTYEHFVRMKTANEESVNNGTYAWNKLDTDIADSYSPPIVENSDVLDLQRNRAFEELRAVFTTAFAHKAYMLFYRCIHTEMMEHILKNHEHIQQLCHDYEQEIKATSVNNDNADKYNTSVDCDDTENVESIDKGACSFGNISVIGNRFEIQKDDARSQVLPETSIVVSRETTCPLSAGRQLRGNWLAYWEHEIGRPEKDTIFNIKQIKLQTFNGHTNSVRCLYVLDNENSFMSGSRDKTVKLWSLRSQGDGTTVSSCQYTYTGHKKSILSLTFLESLRYAVTCDGMIHCWDPYMGSLLGCPESSRPVPVNILASSPSPSTTLLVGTTDITLRVIDCRTFQYVNEMKISMNPTGLIRCIAVSPSTNWVALGQASGFLTILDTRTGLIIASWKGHECEILQLEAINETTIVSSSLDQTIAVWSAIDGKLKFHMKGATEPVHCMAMHEQALVIGTTANRIGVYTAVETTASLSSSKLRSDAFKGILTALAVLPLNRLLLLGADNGGIILLC